MQKTPPSPETVALVRRRYAAGDVVGAIQADAGNLSIGVFYNCLDGKYDDGSGATLPLPRVPRRCAGLRIMRNPSRAQAAGGANLAQRRSAGRADRKRLADSGMTTEDFKRDTRALAVVVRTLRELEAFDVKRTKGNEQKPTNDEPLPRDIGELRRELARKLEDLVRGESGTAPMN